MVCASHQRPLAFRRMSPARRRLSGRRHASGASAQMSNDNKEHVESIGVTCPRGFRAAGGTCGIKASGKPDLTLLVADHPCAAAGVFTTNKMISPTIVVDREHLRNGRAQAIICNSG